MIKNFFFHEAVKDHRILKVRVEVDRVDLRAILDIVPKIVLDRENWVETKILKRWIVQQKNFGIFEIDTMIDIVAFLEIEKLYIVIREKNHLNIYLNVVSEKKERKVVDSIV